MGELYLLEMYEVQAFQTMKEERTGHTGLHSDVQGGMTEVLFAREPTQKAWPRGQRQHRSKVAAVLAISAAALLTFLCAPLRLRSPLVNGRFLADSRPLCNNVSRLKRQTLQKSGNVL